jgi:hypothetical protein
MPLSESNDTIGSDNDPLLALTLKRSPEEIQRAWMDCIETAPEKLQANFDVSIELNLGADCTLEQFQSIASKLGQILGVCNINPGQMSKPAPNVICLNTKLFKGYESAIMGYIRDFIFEWLNSEENTFLISIAVWHE